MSPSLTAWPSGAMKEIVYCHTRSTDGHPTEKDAADWSWPVAWTVMSMGALTTLTTALPARTGAPGERKGEHQGESRGRRQRRQSALIVFSRGLRLPGVLRKRADGREGHAGLDGGIAPGVGGDREFVVIERRELDRLRRRRA